MRVQVTKEAKKWLTVAEMPIVKKIIADFKEDGTTVNDIAKQAVAIITGSGAGIKIYEAHAEIAGNRRVYDYYSDDSGYLDIWIEFVAFASQYTGDRFITGGAYLSDIWSFSFDSREEIISHMYFKEYKEK